MAFFDAFYSIGAYVVPFLCVLTVVVFIHEMGHFLVGRWCGIKVDAFSLGFGPQLFSFTDRRGTVWRLAALPLGGYVKFHGDANAASVSDDEAIAAMPASERAVSFAAQPVWKRTATVAAGPASNFLLAIVVFTCLFYSYGRYVLTPRIGTIVSGSAAEAAGIQAGDIVRLIDGSPIVSFDDFKRIVSASADIPLTLVIDRGGQSVTLQATPRPTEISTVVGKRPGGQMGVTASERPEDLRFERYGLVESFQQGATETWFVVKQTATYLGRLVIGRESTKQLSGPAGLAHLSGVVAKIGFAEILNLIAIFSISVGLLNLAPIPLLDGGHLVFYAFEAARGRALPEKAQEWGFKFGLAVVALLMIVATYNDLTRLGPQVLKWMMQG